MLTPELTARLRRTAALDAAYDHDPRAVSQFDGVAAAADDTAVEEWRVRAALWSGDYAKALGWMEHMPAALATQPRWRYWRARAVAATAGPEAAAPLYAEIAGLRDYYGYLAADRLHRGYSLNARASPDDVNTQAAMAADAGMIRARELFACALTDEAGAEWSAVVGGAESAVKVQAAHLASRWGWYAQAIATLAQAAEWDDVRLRYPRPFLDVVAAASQLAGVPPDWIWAVMRQESLFRTDALSRADARGLMQMLPSTAAAVARRWRLAPPGKVGLFDPVLKRSRWAPRICASCSIVIRASWFSASPPTTQAPRRSRAGCRPTPWTPTCGWKTSPTPRRAPMCSTSSNTSSHSPRCAMPSRRVLTRSCPPWSLRRPVL